jgi:hypothetical protein
MEVGHTLQFPSKTCAEDHKRNNLTGGQVKSLDEAGRLIFILRSNTFCIAVESNLL